MMTTSIRFGLASATLVCTLGLSASPIAASATNARAVVARAVSLGRSRDLGPAAAQRTMHFAILLRYRNGAQLDRLVAAQGDPASPHYRHYLTAQQFRARFSPSTKTYARVAATLHGAGFSIETSAANRTVLDVSAPVSTVDRYFATDIHRVNFAGRSHIANVRPALLPVELQDDVVAVDGFTDIVSYAPAIKVGTKLPPFQQEINGRLHGPAPWFSLGPGAFAEGYDLPVQHAVSGGSGGATYDGSGRVAGLIAITDPADSDLTAWLTYFKITRTGQTTRIPVDGGAQGDDGSLPAALDYETNAGLAPGADIDIYEIPDLLDAHLLDVYNRIVADDTADTVDTGFGACELLNTIDPTGISAIFEQGTAQGQVFDAVMAINGPVAPGCDAPTVYAPADSPYAVAIGGTTYNVRNNGKYFGENYWDTDSFGAGGGGVSQIFPLPSYQQNVAGIVSSGRNVPDLSFDGDGDTGESLFVDGQWFNLGSVGGTELGTGIFAACMIEAEQMAGARLPSVTETLYDNWLHVGYGKGALRRAHDIIGGVPWPPLVPRKGYDLATGIGSLDCFNAATTLL